MMLDAVDDPVALEVDGKFTVIPARDGRLAHGRVFLIGETKPVQYKILGVAPNGHGQLGRALLANGNTDDIGMCRDAECYCQERDH